MLERDIGTDETACYDIMSIVFWQLQVQHGQRGKNIVVTGRTYSYSPIFLLRTVVGFSVDIYKALR
jgi:hypothetical protein